MRTVFATVFALALHATSAAAQDEPLTLPLVVHAPENADEAHLALLLEGVREAYAPVGIAFVVTRRVLPDEARHLATIRDRHTLATRLVAHAINVFFVEHADDPTPSEATVRAAERAGFEPTGRLAGAHLVARGHVPTTYVIVTLDSSRFTLAHELGHVLGAGHARDPESIMSYAPGRSHFTERERAVFVAHARRALRRRELRPVEDAPLP